MDKKSAYVTSVRMNQPAWAQTLSPSLEHDLRESHCLSAATLCAQIASLNGDPTLGVRLYEDDTGLRFTWQELNRIHYLWNTLGAI